MVKVSNFKLESLQKIEHEQLLIINKKEEVKHALSCLTPSFL